MYRIEIAPLENGAHRNQTYNGILPDGWALLPPGVGTPQTLENFPFGAVEVEDIDGVPTVTKWTPGVMPEPEPEPEPAPTVWDELDGAYQEGVNTAYDQ